MRTDKVAAGGSHAKRKDWAHHRTVVKKIRGMLRNEALGGGRDDLKRDLRRVETKSRFSLLFAHDLFGKPVPTFPNHALTW